MPMDAVELQSVDLADWLARQCSPQAGRPWVTLSYAQSLDGSIALEEGKPFPLSGDETLRLTHRLRAAHDGILIGIGTLLADDPQLTVRLAPGDDPQPVILDSHLRTPLTAALLQRGRQHPWIACAADASPDRRQQFNQAGAQLLPVQRGADGRLNLPEVLGCLSSRGIARLMVEGGAQVIRSFLAAGLVDWAVITVSPRWLGGLTAISVAPGPGSALAQIVEPVYRQLGADLVVSGRVAS